MTLYETLHTIQQNLKVPKSKYNSFGGYYYRSCEDILDAAKKYFPAGVLLLLHDSIEERGGHVYVCARAILTDGEIEIATTGMARDAIDKKGQDAAQVTGGASSYARKYALNGLFCIDDTKDADATNTHGKETLTEKEYMALLKSISEAKDQTALSEVKNKLAAAKPRMTAEQLKGATGAYTAQQEKVK